MHIKYEAMSNFLALSQNSYPGRGIVLGRTPDGSFVQIYWVMGRSEGSRNRILESVPSIGHGWIRTRVADASKHSGDPALLIYKAMAEDMGTFVVSNGTQTEAVLRGGILILDQWQYEPDDPNFTPRITGRIRFLSNGLDMQLVILKKSPFGKKCDRFSYTYSKSAAGYGYYISTYCGDGNPLPSFQGEPIVLPISNTDPAEIAKAYWAVLNEENRVAVAVKIIPIDHPSKIAIINRY